MPKRKPFSSFVHIPQDLDFKIREGIPTGFYLALQLRFLRSSESIGHHDSEIVDDRYFDRDDAGALGVIAAGCQSADGAIVHPGAGGGFGGRNPGWTTRKRAAQDRLDAC